MKALILTLLPLTCLWPAMTQAAPAAAAAQQHSAPSVHPTSPAAAHRIARPHPALRRPATAHVTPGVIGGPAMGRRHDHAAKTAAVGGAPRHTSAATVAISGTDSGHGH